MRLGLLGGTFNPPHHGHIICAQEARRQLQLDEVWLVPSGEPPHRTIASGDDPGKALRLQMCRLAINGQPGLGVSAIEVDRSGMSYTVDTLEQLAADAPDTRMTLIIGADQAMSFETWREPERIGDLAWIAVAARADHDRSGAVATVVRATGRQPVAVEMPRIDISSSLVRERASRRETVSHFVPAEIGQLIESEGLYRR